MGWFFVVTASFVLPEFLCLRCSHIWSPRKSVLPMVCPKCKSPYWNVPKGAKK